MVIERTIDVLNNLIQINNDRIEGYKTACEETNDTILKDMFGGFIATSYKCKAELTREVIALGGIPSDNTLLTGQFYRIWMNIKAAFTGKDSKAIISSCEYGDDIAKETYKKVLREDFKYLSAYLALIIIAQLVTLNKEHDSVKAMKNVLV